MTEETDLCTIFEQDGNMYCVISHDMSAKDRAKMTAQEIRYLPKIPRAQMRVVTVAEFRKMPFKSPSKV